jgi:hypothetical protein
MVRGLGRRCDLRRVARKARYRGQELAPVAD